MWDEDGISFFVTVPPKRVLIKSIMCKLEVLTRYVKWSSVAKNKQMLATRYTLLTFNFGILTQEFAYTLCKFLLQ